MLAGSGSNARSRQPVGPSRWCSKPSKPPSLRHRALAPSCISWSPCAAKASSCSPCLGSECTRPYWSFQAPGSFHLGAELGDASVLFDKGSAGTVTLADRSVSFFLLLFSSVSVPSTLQRVSVPVSVSSAMILSCVLLCSSVSVASTLQHVSVPVSSTLCTKSAKYKHLTNRLVVRTAKLFI